jgi:hypothetical protein
LIKRENRQSGYGFATTLLTILVVILLLLELGGDVFERMAGNYLRWSNESRPKAGRAWEYQSLAHSTLKQLDSLVTEQEEIRRELQNPSDFAILPDLLSGGKSLTLSREKFVELYDKLPDLYSFKLGSPIKLMELTTSTGWNRVVFVGAITGVDLCYLNDDNYVLERVTLNPDYFQDLSRWGADMRGNLVSNPDFSGRIFSVGEFFRALNSMKNVERELGFFQELLNYNSALLKVGISRQIRDGLVEMGFQFADGVTILYPVEEDFAQKLLDFLPEEFGDIK